MDLTLRLGGDSSNKKGAGMGQSEGSRTTALEEYDPSHPLDSSDEEEAHGSLSFESSSTTTTTKNVVSNRVLNLTPEPEPPRLPRAPLLSVSSSEKTAKTKESDLDLNSIPMPSDEYRRPTIQFSIPTRHRLMSISSLIKRQKGVMRKSQDKGGVFNFNSEVSKAFHKGDAQESSEFQDEGEESGKPKISLVHEIFGSDDEEQEKEEEEELEGNTTEVVDENYRSVNEEDSQETNNVSNPFTETTLEENKWKKTVAEIIVAEPPLFDLVTTTNPELNVITPDEEPIISIKPSSELLEVAGNESSDSPSPEHEPEPELITIDHEDEIEGSDDFRGKENKQIVLECVSDDDDFEVTFVGISRSNLTDLRQGRLPRRKDRNVPRLKTSASPVNGFEEGEIVESDKKKKKDKKNKKKSKKRKRSKDSRVSSKNYDRSDNADSSEKKSLSESDSKEVSWRKPKTATKSRNYRNGKKESEEKVIVGDRTSKRDEITRRKSKSGSPNRYSSSYNALKSKSRRHRSISSTRHRSRSKSFSRSPFSRRLNRSRGTKRFRRGGSYRSRSSNRSSPSHSRSRSLTRRKVRRRHSPSPARRYRNRSSSNSTPLRLSKSPRTRKRNRSIGSDKVKNRSNSPVAVHSARNKSSKPEVPIPEDNKKRPKKDKSVADDAAAADKDKKRKKKKREKSLSPVKAIVADGDSIVVSLSFQTPVAKEEVLKPSKPVASASTHDDQDSDNETSSNYNKRDTCEEIDAPIANHKPTPRKGTILINLDASPTREKKEKSPEMPKTDRNEVSKGDDKKPQDQKLDKESGVDEPVTSSHDNSADNTQNGFSSISDKTNSPADKAASASRSPYKFGEYFVSSTCDSKSSPHINSPKPPKISDTADTPQKPTRNSPFEISRSTNDNGPDKGKTPSPEVIHISSKSSVAQIKPMIGNIPGLFPSGFAASGNLSTPPLIIPAPPKALPTTAPSNLFNNLVSVASALYAPLLAAKQPAQISNTGPKHNNLSGSSLFSKHNRNGTEGGDSPFSPNSSDGDDLFEPPNGDGNHVESHKKTSGDRPSTGSNSNASKFVNEDSGMKRNIFDSLFTGPQKMSHSKGHGKQKKPRDSKRGKHKKFPKRMETDKNGEMEMNSRLTEEVPNSAVALKINEKYLKKLNRQERVVEEVKLSLKPHYIKKHITKEEYKDILRKTVPKVCHNKTGEINPHKIKELVEAYVKKYRKSRKLDNKST